MRFGYGHDPDHSGLGCGVCGRLVAEESMRWDIIWKIMQLHSPSCKLTLARTKTSRWTKCGKKQTRKWPYLESSRQQIFSCFVLGLFFKIWSYSGF